MTVKIAPKYFLENTLRPEGLVVKKLRVARHQAAESIRRLYRTTSRYSGHHIFVPCLYLDTQGVRSEVLDWHLVRNNLVKADRWDRLCGLGVGSSRSLTVITSKCVATSRLEHDFTERLERLDQELNPIAQMSSHQAEPNSESLASAYSTLASHTNDAAGPIGLNYESQSESTLHIKHAAYAAVSSLTVADRELLYAIDDMLSKSMSTMSVKYASIMSSNIYASGYLAKHIADHVDKG